MLLYIRNKIKFRAEEVMSKVDKEKNRLKCARYRARKGAKQLEKTVEEQEKKLNAIKEVGSPDDIARIEKNVEFAKRNYELYSKYKLENTLTKEQYNQKKAELRKTLFNEDKKRSNSLASRKYYFKTRYGSEWKQYMYNEKPAPLNIPFKSNTNEYKRERYRLKKEEQQEMEAEMLKINPNFKRDSTFIFHRIRNKRKFYDNHKSVIEIPKHLTRYEMYMSKYGYTDFFDLPQEIKSQLRQWDRLDIAERFALHIIAVYVDIIKELKLDKIPTYAILDFLPPHMEITNSEIAYEKLGEQGFYGFRAFVNAQLNKAVEKYRAETPVEKSTQK